MVIIFSEEENATIHVAIVNQHWEKKKTSQLRIFRKFRAILLQLESCFFLIYKSSEMGQYFQIILPKLIRNGSSICGNVLLLFFPPEEVLTFFLF